MKDHSIFFTFNTHGRRRSASVIMDYNNISDFTDIDLVIILFWATLEKKN